MNRDDAARQSDSNAAPQSPNLIAALNLPGFPLPGDMPQSDATVLIIDDNVEGAQALADMLEWEGCRTAHAINGKDALFHLRGSPLPCIILLDLQMPVMNGWEFLEERRKDGVLAAVPVVVISAVLRLPICLDAKAILGKPVDMAILLALITECRHSNWN